MKKNKYNKKYFNEAWGLGDFFHTPTPEEIKNAQRVQKSLDASKNTQDFDALAASMADSGYKGPGPASINLPEYSTYGKTTNAKDPIKFSFKRGEKISDTDYVLGGDSVKKAADAAYKKAVSTRTGEDLTKANSAAVDATDTTGLTPDFYSKELPKKPRTNDTLGVSLADPKSKEQIEQAAMQTVQAAPIPEESKKVVVEAVKKVQGNAIQAKKMGEVLGAEGKKISDAASQIVKNHKASKPPVAENTPQAVEEVKEKALGPIESLWSRFKNTSFYKTVEGWIKAITDFFGKKIGSSNITYGNAVLWTILTAIAAYIIYKIAKYLYRKFRANKKRKLSEASKTYWYLKNHTNLSEAKCCKIARYVYTR